MRADLISNTMSRNNKAMWQTGPAAVTTQFWTWNARMVDNFLSKDITAKERMRMLFWHSMMYGMPIGASTGALSMGPLPIDEMVRGFLTENDIVYDDNIVTQLMVDGIPSAVVEGISGTKYNFGSRYGTKALDEQPLMLFGSTLREGLPSLTGGFIWEALAEDDVGMRWLLGASDGGINKLIDAYWAGYGMIRDLFDVENPNKWKTTRNGLIDFISNTSTSASNAKKIWMTANFGYYETKSGRQMTQAEQDAWVNFTTGLSPQAHEDRWTMEDWDRNQNSWKDEALGVLRSNLAKAGRAIEEGDTPWSC